MDVATATSADFAPHVGARFASTLDDGSTLELELTECVDMPANPRATQGFSLLFRHASENAVVQQQHDMSHDVLGEFRIFLVPVQQDDQGTYYEAVFSRIPDATP